MPTGKNRWNSSSLLIAALVTVFALGLMAVPAVIAAPAATEGVISIQRVGRPPGVSSVMVTRLVVPPQTVWETDPDAGPLTLTVEKGRLGVTLGGGSARIERQSNILMDEQFLDEQITPLPPGLTATLRSGDRLVIVRGFQLTVTNDQDVPSSAIMVRVQ
jgi:hypothetical protein